MSYMRVLPCWETPCWLVSKKVRLWAGDIFMPHGQVLFCVCRNWHPKFFTFLKRKLDLFFSSSKDILTLNDGDNSWLWSSFCWVWGPHCWWCHQKPNWRWSYWDFVKHYFDSLSTWLCQRFHCGRWVTDCWEIVLCEPLGLLGKIHTKSLQAFLYLQISITFSSLPCFSSCAHRLPLTFIRFWNYFGSTDQALC